MTEAAATKQANVTTLHVPPKCCFSIFTKVNRDSSMVFSVVVLPLQYYFCLRSPILMYFIEEFARLRICLFRYYTCQLFFSKMLEIFSSPQNLNFQRFTDGFRRLPKISKDLRRSPKVSNDFRRFSDNFLRQWLQNKASNGFQRIFNQSRVLLKSSEDVLTTSRTWKNNWIFV